MKLVTVVAHLGVGGAEAVAAALTLESRRHGHEVLVAGAGGHHVAALEAAGARHRAVRLDSRRATHLTSAVLALRGALRRHRPDLVHAHNVKAACVARLAMGRSDVPLLVTLHGIPGDALSTGSVLLRRCADHVVAVSPYVAGQLVDHGFPTDRLSVIENTVAPLPTRPRAEARARLALPTDAPVVLCLARLAEQKRHDLLVRAWAQVPDDALLLLAGDGPTRPQVAAEVRRLGLEGRVRMLGHRTDPDWLLAGADLVVLPTDWEGLPISLLEAMAAGVPVIASGVGGVVETVGEAVRLVPPGTVPPLAAAITALLTDDAGRAELGRRGRELVTSRFGPRLMVEAYHQLYSALAARQAVSA